MVAKTKKTKNFYSKIVVILEKYVSSILLLAIRLWIGLVFFKSGLKKISNIDQTVILFEHDYNIPILYSKLVAILATATELGCGSFIMIGLLTRLVSIPLIAMTLVIQFFVLQNQEHFYWLFLLSTLFIYGAGKLSVDGNRR